MNEGRLPRSNLRRKRVLVTGGAGFIGSQLIDRLLAQGDEVICTDNLFTASKRNIEAPLLAGFRRAAPPSSTSRIGGGMSSSPMGRGSISDALTVGLRRIEEAIPGMFAKAVKIDDEN